MLIAGTAYEAIASREVIRKEMSHFPLKREIHGQLGSVHAMNFGRNPIISGSMSVIRMPNAAPDTSYF